LSEFEVELTNHKTVEMPKNVRGEQCKNNLGTLKTDLRHNLAQSVAE
jgi:hypothetical protein